MRKVHDNENSVFKLLMSFQVFKSYIATQQTSKTLGKIFVKHKLIDCKRQLSNLKRLLCSSNFSTNKSTFKTAKCGKSCFCYDYIIRG